MSGSGDNGVGRQEPVKTKINFNEYKQRAEGMKYELLCTNFDAGLILSR